MSALHAAGPVLVHFFDFAVLSCNRVIPYIREWERRYRDAGLSVVGVHTPRFPFTADAAAVEAAVERLGITYPVAIDNKYDLWNDYGIEGWPALFLWTKGGALAWFHFGEGEYRATEEAIQVELFDSGSRGPFPAPMEPLRPTDDPESLLVVPTPEILPDPDQVTAWAGGEGSEPIETDYEAGGVFIAADGNGAVRYSIDDGPTSELWVDQPELIELESHPFHETHHLRIKADPGVRIWSVTFAPGMPNGDMIPPPAAA